jgi:tetratricopeptide (TPR) repeat protein
VAMALVAHEPRVLKYSYLAGLCLQRLGRHRAAVALYLLALNPDSRHAPSAFRVGECCAQLGDEEAARRAYEHAVELGRVDEGYRHLQSEAMARLSGASVLRSNRSAP